MKSLAFTVLVLLLKSQHPLSTLAAETNATYIQVLQASNNVQAVISALPAVEQLWPQDPGDYLKSVNAALHVLGGALNSSEAKLTLINTYSNMLQKSCPTNIVEAASWIQTKRDTILFGLNFDEIRGDKAQWIGIATFVGEIRSQIIPNYKNRGIMLNGFGFTSQEIAQNEQNRAEDSFQAALRQTHDSLIFFLRDGLARFPSSNPANKDFASEVMTAAHLSGEDLRKLETE